MPTESSVAWLTNRRTQGGGLPSKWRTGPLIGNTINPSSKPELVEDSVVPVAQIDLSWGSAS